MAACIGDSLFSVASGKTSPSEINPKASAYTSQIKDVPAALRDESCE
jgi:hypothetical protein